MDFSTMSIDDTIQYFTQNKWGSVYDDDKYFKYQDLEDNFIVFCVYSFAHLKLPRPTLTQLMIARHLCGMSYHHKMVWASRGLSANLYFHNYM